MSEALSNDIQKILCQWQIGHQIDTLLSPEVMSAARKRHHTDRQTRNLVQEGLTCKKREEILISEDS